MIMDAENTYATSAVVIGNIWASDYATPTPVEMTTAISNMDCQH
jgi:hypothetical protein